MVSEIFAWLFAIFVIDPLHAEIRDRVARANLPVEVLQRSQQCLGTQGPQLLQRAGEDPVWAVGTAVGIATGWVSPARLFDPADANCSAFVQVFDAEAGVESGLRAEEQVTRPA
jgi:hypothetical protein